MKMKNKILAAYPGSCFVSSEAPNIYVADFTERTESRRKIEIHENLPFTPDGTTEMDCLHIENPIPLAIDFNLFDDNQFKDEHQKDCPHCECCLFPSENDDKTWIAFIEIKDCKPKNISDYKNKMKEQILSSLSLFRKQGIIAETKKVYGIISCPRHKTAFNDAIFVDRAEYKRLFHNHKISFLVTNEISVLNNNRIIPK